MSAFITAVKRDIYPTPIIGMIGLIEDIDKTITLDFKQGDIIILLGKTKNELGASEYIAEFYGLEKGKISNINFALERRLHKFILDLNEKGLLQSAHDVAEGGLAVALAECSMQEEFGIEVKLDSELRNDVILFGETQSRFIITVKPGNLNIVKELMAENRIPNTVLGLVKGENFKIDINGKEVINLSVRGMNKIWREAFNFNEIKKNKLREECGIAGIFNFADDNSSSCFYALYALQHRGQESGIASNDGKRSYHLKNPGLVLDIFDDEILSQLVGHISIGHVRCGTIGGTE